MISSTIQFFFLKSNIGYEIAWYGFQIFLALTRLQKDVTFSFDPSTLYCFLSVYHTGLVSCSSVLIPQYITLHLFHVTLQFCEEFHLRSLGVVLSFNESLWLSPIVIIGTSSFWSTKLHFIPVIFPRFLFKTPHTHCSDWTYWFCLHNVCQTEIEWNIGW